MFNKLTTVLLFSILAATSFQSETVLANRCENLFKKSNALVTSKQTSHVKSGQEILHERDNKLHTTPVVEKAVQFHNRKNNEKVNKPADKINIWLNHLTNLSNKADYSLQTMNVLKTTLHQKFVIKFEEVPQSYYDLQAKIAKDRGNGNVYVTHEMKKQMSETVIIDQQKSLDYWIEYLVSKDTRMYPMWLKYWMFTGMTKLSKYNAENGIFGNRTKETVAPFPELNREALAYVADVVLKKMNKESIDQIQDPNLVQLIEGMNFGKIYGYTLLKLGTGKDGQFSTNDGKWIIYPKGSDHIPLVKSLEGKNTGWCTAGTSTAKSQLAKGDFHVYYSLDKAGQPTQPRVAIRMEGDQIAEVRGVAKDQNLDGQISNSSIVKNKMTEFGDKADIFLEKDADMKMLTQIEKKHNLSILLGKEELKFLYEFDKDIKGFGFQKDPRVNEITSRRDLKSDLVVIFDNKFSKDEISTTRDEFVEKKNIKVHWGNLDLYNVTSTEGFTLPEYVNGFLYIYNLNSAKELILPKGVKHYVGPSDIQH